MSSVEVWLARRHHALVVQNRDDPASKFPAWRNGHGNRPEARTKVSRLEIRCGKGQISDLSRASNGIIIGEALADKIGVGVGNTIQVSSGAEAPITTTVVGIFRSGVVIDEGQAYTLISTAQVLARQSGLINQLRVRLNEPRTAPEIAQRIEAQTGTEPCRGRRQTPT